MNRRIKLFAWLAGVALSLAGVIPVNGQPSNVRVVNDDAPAGGNGQSWATAYNDLQAALTEAAGGGIVEIWVAAGSYVPSVRLNSAHAGSETFQLINGVSLYGGFAGTETARNQRQPSLFDDTVLNGQLTGTTYAFHVLFAGAAVTNSTVVDGFKVVNGRATSSNLSFPEYRRGGGILIDGGELTVANCLFEANRAHVAGAAISIWYVSGDAASRTNVIKDCEFVLNFGTSVGESCLGGGVGIEYVGVEQTLTVTGCTFDDNNAMFGGGVGVWQTGDTMAGVTTIMDCTFVNNDAASDGGGINAYRTKIVVTDCVFDSNDAILRGGAIAGQEAGMAIERCEFEDNMARFSGGAVDAFGSTFSPEVIVSSCVFTGNASDRGGAVGAAGIVNGGLFLDISGCTFESNSGQISGFFGSGGAVNANCHLLDPPLFSDCVFRDNEAYHGGAIAWSTEGEGPFLVAERCVFVDNRAGGHSEATDLRPRGGACLLINAGSMVNCQFFGNLVESDGSRAGWGGALSLRDGGRFDNCLFVGNEADWLGGAIHIEAPDTSTLTLGNCTLVDNAAVVGSGGLGRAGGVYVDTAECVIENSILWENVDDTGTSSGSQLYLIDGASASVEYSDVSGGWTGTGNINSDPCFVDRLGSDEAVGTGDENFRLNMGSPASDVGSDALIGADSFDLDSDANTSEDIPLDLAECDRIDGSAVDMGAYEQSGCIADFNEDGYVDTVDFIGYLNAYASGNPAADVNCDGVVNSLDYFLFLNQFSAGCDACE